MLLNTLAALGIGLLIGAERSRQQAGTEPVQEDSAGIRTFALVALSGNILTWLPQQLQPWAVIIGFFFTVCMALLSYLRTTRKEPSDKGITTEVALVITYVLGCLTGFDMTLQAMSMAIVVLTLLYFKSLLHQFSRSLSKSDIRETIQFLIITVIILPILPDRSFGPYDSFNPRDIWLMVVLISAIGFLAYVTMKFLGKKLSLGISAALGGLVSSTAVTVAMARISRQDPEAKGIAAMATVLACAILFPRMTLLATLFSPETGLTLLLPVAVIFLSALMFVWLWYRRQPTDTGPTLHHAPQNPLSLKTSLLFGALYGLIVFFTHMAEARFGYGGLFVVAAVSGLTDVDAITLSISRMTETMINPRLAAQAILLASASNTIVKLGLGLFLGHRQMRFGICAGLLPMIVISLISIRLL